MLLGCVSRFHIAWDVVVAGLGVPSGGVVLRAGTLGQGGL